MRLFFYSRGQNTSVKDAHNKTSSAVYDKLGNVTLLRGPLGAATSYAFDEMGKLENKTTPSGGTKSYTYNALNLKETFTNARGQTRSFTYDAKGRITGYTCPEDTLICTLIFRKQIFEL